MTSQSPRIYTYKITFEEVPYYYYGVHKEKRYNEEYWGSPYTHKWCWEFYTPKKQILEIFEYSDEGWSEAQEIENRVIKPFFNADKWCLNENCAGKTSLKVLRETGKRSGKIQGTKNRKLGIGIFSLTPEQRTEYNRNNGNKIKELGLGIFNFTKEQLSEAGKKAANMKWICLETGHISNAGGLTTYQRKRGIDTSKRKRIE
jgi:hypothetical protein